MNIDALRIGRKTRASNRMLHLLFSCGNGSQNLHVLLDEARTAHRTTSNGSTALNFVSIEAPKERCQLHTDVETKGLDTPQYYRKVFAEKP
jgi:hypothetical protein